MNIVFFSRYFFPHIGGVEEHLYQLSLQLTREGDHITVLTYKFDNKLDDVEMIDGIQIIRIRYPEIKYIGLIYIWKFIWDNRHFVLENDVTHIHDVFIWYLPFKFIYPYKKFFLTIHGLEWSDPFSSMGIFQKKLAIKFSDGTIGVGKFIEKYVGVKFNLVIYGATNIPSKIYKKKHEITFIGRLSKDTGILKFLQFLKKHPNMKANFVGDGELREECEKFGKVYGFMNPKKFFEKSEYIIPGGYLACLEAMANKAKIKVFWDTKLKEDYWKMSPMYKFIKNEDIVGAYNFARQNTWEKLTKKYIRLWKV